MTNFKHCNNCRTYTTCLEQGCGQVSAIRASAGTDDDAERVLKQELAELHVLYHRQAIPILNQLARLEAMKLPRPMFAGGQWYQFKPEVHADLTGRPLQPPANPGELLRRLEHERAQALQLLRQFRAAGCVPDFLEAQLSYVLDHLAP